MNCLTSEAHGPTPSSSPVLTHLSVIGPSLSKNLTKESLSSLVSKSSTSPTPLTHHDLTRRLENLPKLEILRNCESGSPFLDSLDSPLMTSSLFQSKSEGSDSLITHSLKAHSSPMASSCSFDSPPLPDFTSPSPDRLLPSFHSRSHPHTRSQEFKSPSSELWNPNGRAGFKENRPMVPLPCPILALPHSMNPNRIPLNELSLHDVVPLSIENDIFDFLDFPSSSSFQKSSELIKGGRGRLGVQMKEEEDTSHFIKAPPKILILPAEEEAEYLNSLVYGYDPCSLTTSKLTRPRSKSHSSVYTCSHLTQDSLSPTPTSPIFLTNSARNLSSSSQTSKFSLSHSHDLVSSKSIPIPIAPSNSRGKRHFEPCLSTSLIPSSFAWTSPTSTHSKTSQNKSFEFWTESRDKEISTSSSLPTSLYISKYSGSKTTDSQSAAKPPPYPPLPPPSSVRLDFFQTPIRRRIVNLDLTSISTQKPVPCFPQLYSTGLTPLAKSMEIRRDHENDDEKNGKDDFDYEDGLEFQSVPFLNRLMYSNSNSKLEVPSSDELWSQLLSPDDGMDFHQDGKRRRRT